MDVIPVIDLKGGVVVRARMGRRDQYLPIETPLLPPTSDPVDVAGGLLDVYPFATLDVADLDAIEGRGDNRAALMRLRARFPQLVLWVDSGICDRASAQDWLIPHGANLSSAVKRSPTPRWSATSRTTPALRSRLISAGRSFRDRRRCSTRRSCWPRRVIAMTLARVGKRAGPDFDRLGRIRDAAAGKKSLCRGGRARRRRSRRVTARWNCGSADRIIPA